MRLDTELTARKLFSSRQKAKNAVVNGLIKVDGVVCTKPSFNVDENFSIEIAGDVLPYVGRGGLKLEKSMRLWPIRLEDAVCMDIGASTGGFTDCMLQNGARKVYAVDVGYGQLDYKLRIDPRVVNMEKCNIRYLDFSLIEEPIDFISIDVSFISLKLVFPVAAKLLEETGGSLVCLVKPQFEAGREQVGKKGIVRDRNVHAEVIRNVIGYAGENGLCPQGLTYSPVTGAKGNIEYLLYLSKTSAETTRPLTEADILTIVNTSHEELE